MENSENEVVNLEKNKNNKVLLIILCIAIIILTGAIVYLVLFRNNNDNKSNKPSYNNKSTEKVPTKDETENENDIIKNTVKDNNDNNTNEVEFDLNADDIKEIDMKNKENTCSAIPDDFSYQGRQIITVKNFYLDGVTHTLYIDRNMETRKHKLLMDGKEIWNYNLNEEIPVRICNFDKYILYEIGWEGFYVNLFNAKGEKVLDYVNLNPTSENDISADYSDGKLYIKERDMGSTIYTEDDMILKYYIDTTSETIEKKDLQSEKYVCEAVGCY